MSDKFDEQAIAALYPKGCDVCCDEQYTRVASALRAAFAAGAEAAVRELFQVHRLTTKEMDQHGYLKPVVVDDVHDAHRLLRPAFEREADAQKDVDDLVSRVLAAVTKEQSK